MAVKAAGRISTDRLTSKIGVQTICLSDKDISQAALSEDRRMLYMGATHNGMIIEVIDNRGFDSSILEGVKEIVPRFVPIGEETSI
jgi:hypothetical protein